MSGTYWVIVIRPRLSRTATTSMRDSGDRSVAILYRPAQIIRQLAYDRKCKHKKTRCACLVDVAIPAWTRYWRCRAPQHGVMRFNENRGVKYLRSLRSSCLMSLTIIEFQALARHTESSRRRWSAVVDRLRVWGRKTGVIPSALYTTSLKGAAIAPRWPTRSSTSGDIAWRAHGSNRIGHRSGFIVLKAGLRDRSIRVHPCSNVFLLVKKFLAPSPELSLFSNLFCCGWRSILVFGRRLR